MHRSRLAPALPLAVILAIGISGCVPQPEPTPSATAESATPTSASPASSPAPSVSPTAEAGAPASDAVLMVSLDHASIAAGSTLEYSLNAVDAWTKALGAAPTQSPVQGPPGYDFQLTALEWPGLKLTVPNDGSTGGAQLFVSSPTVAGHPVVTSEGIGVGSTRAEALAAGAVEGFDNTELRLEVRDAPGTQSLQKPGQVGRQFVMLVLDGDSVASIHTPANDFSDL